MISALDDVQPLSTMKTISFCEEISNGAAVARKLKRVGESQVKSADEVDGVSVEVCDGGVVKKKKTKYHVSHSLDYKHGYAIQKHPEVTVGGMPLPFNNLSEKELEALANFKPTLTYGQAEQALPEDFLPAHVMWDKKVLRFYAWFKQTVHESPAEHYRVCHVHIFYYLEDGSIAVLEPKLDNSGINQGIIIRCQRIPKNDVGDHWNWKDINNGTNITIYGKIFHVYDCDKWSRDWMESQGIEISAMEDCPEDPYMVDRKSQEPKKSMQTPLDFDKMRQFLEMDRRVLRFYCVLDGRDQMFGQMRKFIMHYYLSDDAMEIREVRIINNGYDPFPCLIYRHRIPKDCDDIEPSFPLGSVEITDQEVQDYFSLIDFKIGKTILVYNRRFLIYDLDDFTKAFYWKNFGMTDFTPMDVFLKKPDPPIKARIEAARPSCLLPYLGPIPSAADQVIPLCVPFPVMANSADAEQIVDADDDDTVGEANVVKGDPVPDPATNNQKNESRQIYGVGAEQVVMAAGGGGGGGGGPGGDPADPYSGNNEYPEDEMIRLLDEVIQVNDTMTHMPSVTQLLRNRNVRGLLVYGGPCKNIGLSDVVCDHFTRAVQVDGVNAHVIRNMQMTTVATLNEYVDQAVASQPSILILGGVDSAESTLLDICVEHFNSFTLNEQAVTVVASATGIENLPEAFRGCFSQVFVPIAPVVPHAE